MRQPLLFVAALAFCGAASLLPAQFDPDNGSLDPLFQLNDIQGDSLALQSDGKILLAVRTGSLAKLARLTADGATDPAFPAGVIAGGTVGAVTVQADDKILIVGSFTSIGGVPATGLTRLNPDGSLDPAFSAPAAGSARPLLFSDGKILTNSGDFNHPGLIRLNPDGSADPAFALDASLALNVSSPFLITGDDHIYVAYVPRDNLLRIVRLDADGAVDPTFQFSTAALPNVAGLPQLALDQAGGVLVYGATVIGDNLDPANYTPFLRRFNADGTVDSAFAAVAVEGPPATGSTSRPGISSVVAELDGRILVGGNFTGIDGTPEPGLARLNADGTLDAGFVAGGGRFSGSGSGQPQVFSLLLDENKVLVSGVLGSLSEGSEGHGIGTARLFVGSSIVILPPPPPPGGADLSGKFSGFKITGKAASQSLKLKGSLLVKNSGDHSVKGLQIGVFASADAFHDAQDERLGTVSLADLGFKKVPKLGKAGPVTFKFKLPAAKAAALSGKTILLVLDPDGVLNEPNVVNNTLVAGVLP